VIIEASEDTAVGARVAEQFAATGIATHRVAMPDTHAAKTFGAAGYLATVFADHALHKDDLLIAVVGAAICDVASFVAPTFNRGTKLCLIPTTLVAQADSAVGGKDAINLDQGRNLVGTIHQPIVVIGDIDVACANAERGFKAGLAEIARHALISPSDLLGHLQAVLGHIVSRDSEAIQSAAIRSIEVKADIVSRDEREQGDRVYLNYGHTSTMPSSSFRGSPGTIKVKRSRWG
jgi:3-dehydroquinate synthase/shikimate kinase/3-dehydroquinate synthase